VFDELKPIVLQLYGDQAGDYRNAAELYFDLHRSDWGVPASATWNDWQSNMIASAPVPLAWAPRIADLLNQGVAPMLSVSLPGGFHLINAWGYRASGLAFVHSDDIDRMVITDNENAILGPTQVEVPLDGNSISSFERVVRNAAGEPVLVKLDTPIGNVVGIKSRFGDVDVMVGNRLALAAYPTTYLNGADGQPIGPNGPLVLQGSDQPLVSSKLADFLTSIYAEHPEATGITDAPLIGFNGVTLTAADTGWSALRYTPGPQVADQVAGNGVDDLTAFSFNFPVLRTVRSATLTLELTPQSPGATTDQLFFDRRGYNPLYNFGNALLRDLPVGEPATVTFDLAAMPYGTDGRSLNLLSMLGGGELGVVYGDDAIIQSATLEVRGVLASSVPEPPAVLLMLSAIGALAAARRSLSAMTAERNGHHAPAVCCLASFRPSAIVDFC
ncbi:MAG: hypothetical protein J0H91_23225, partial [Rhodospirillales bacterium]|nr:hypothetical protein [Rhodospirillales bacterium]